MDVLGIKLEIFGAIVLLAAAVWFLLLTCYFDVETRRELKNRRQRQSKTDKSDKKRGLSVQALVDQADGDSVSAASLTGFRLRRKSEIAELDWEDENRSSTVCMNMTIQE